jgi:hypothetical protein
MTWARSKPMTRTAFKSKPGATTKAPAARAKMKSKGPRMTPIRKAARNQDCTLRIPGVCNFDPATTVLCHSNALADGKGMGLKAPDTEACFGCSSCHDVLDGRAPRPDWLSLLLLEGAFIRARGETHIILKKKGLMP